MRPPPVIPEPAGRAHAESARLPEPISALAALLEYPAETIEGDVARARAALEQALPKTRAEEHDTRLELFDRFARAIASLTTEEREELHTATFDVTPACVAYVSIHLFGEENFKRGEFMAALNARYAEAGFTPNGDLPDHLPNLLRFAACADEAERRELVEFCLLGPLDKMTAALSDENPYHALLGSIGAVLRAGYPGLKPAASPLEQMQAHGATCGAFSSACGCAGQEDLDAGETSPGSVTAPKRFEPGRFAHSTHAGVFPTRL